MRDHIKLEMPKFELFNSLIHLGIIYSINEIFILIRDISISSSRDLSIQ